MTVGFCLVGSLFGAGSKGFWSLTLYNDEHLFNPIRWGVIRWVQRTRTSNTARTVHWHSTPKPGHEAKNPTGCPRPLGPFLLYIRCYWSDQVV